MATKKTTKPYTATAIIAGRKFTAKGKDVSEAIAGLKTQGFKGKAVLVVTKGDASRERVLMPQFAHRLFNSMGLTREVALKHASLLFGL